MKRMMLAFGTALAFGVNAADSNFDTSSGVVSIPRITVNNSDVFTGVELLLRPNGTYSILAATPGEDTDGISFPYNSTVEYSGENVGSILVTAKGDSFLIVGISQFLRVGLFGTKTITVKTGGLSLLEPSDGEKNNLYMTIQGQSETFFVRLLWQLIVYTPIVVIFRWIK